MADGSIRIETTLDNSALKQQIKELERELNNIRKEQAKVDAQADNVMAKYSQEREFDAQFPEEFSHREDIDKRAAQELDPIIAKQEELNQKEQEYLAKLDAVKAKLAEQANITSASKQVDSEVKADSVTGKIKSQAEYNSLLDATAAKMATIEAAAERVAAQTGLTKEQILAANPGYQKLSDTMGILKAKAADFGKAGQAAGNKTRKAMNEAEKSTKRVGSATKKGIAGFGAMQLKMMGFMFAMRAISAATNEYMSVNSELEGQMNTLKALWGQVLGPVIEWVINLLVRAISVVNAFVQALTGINFVARANEAALKKQAKAAGSSENQTAGFDEQTKLSGGAGGSGDAVATLPDGSGMDISFLDPVVNAFKKFADDMKPFISTVGDLLRWLYDEVFKPLGEWAATSLLPSVLDLISSAFGVLNDILMALQPMAEWLWENFLQPIAEWTGGVIVDTINWIADALTRVSDWISEHQALIEDIAIVIGSFAAAWGLVTLALNLWNVAVGVWNVIGVIATAVTSAFGAAVAFLTSPIGIIIIAIGALIAIVVLLVKYWDEVKAAAAKCWEWIKQTWNSVASWFNEKIIQPVAKFFSGMWDGLKNGAKKAWDGIKGAFSAVGSFFTGIWNTIKSTFTTIGSVIGDAIGGAFKTVVNSIIGFAEKTINGFIKAINLAIGLINLIPGVNIKELSLLQIPRLATGGIVNRPGRGVPAIIGEAGAEAVLPLENNTEWMDILADKIGGNVTIPIYMDGRKIATYVVDIQKKKAFAMNGA